MTDMDRKRLDEIRRAEDEIRALCETDENRRREAVWKHSNVSSDYFHAIPKERDKSALVIELEREAYMEALGFDIVEFYHDPYLHYLAGLKTQIYKFRHFRDDTPVAKRQPVYESTAFEKCIFGGDEHVIYTEHDAVATKTPLILEREDLDKMEYPDFHKSGCMPRAIRFFEKIRDIAADDFDVAFPQWGRSPWGTAWFLRGTNDVMIDYIEEPEWLLKLLDFIAESRMRWTKQRNEYLGLSIGPANIYNDEVTSPLVSPRLYEECILPSEIKLAEFFGGISYWHSCGNTTMMYPLINSIPNLEMVTVSAWSDVARAAEGYSRDKALEVQLHNYRDVLHPETEHTLSDRIKLIKDSVSGYRSIVHACGLVFIEGYDKTLEMIQRMTDTARGILG